MRSLIVDIGRAVGSAATMTALMRTRVGPLCLDTDADAGAGAVVAPVREIDFGDAVRLDEAMTEAADALEKGTTLVCE